jgi:5-methylcytosine-specific restriction endonuclease McrA
MARAEAYRHLVVSRAGGTCEYCRLVQAATGVTFHIEHILPQHQGGKTILHNLALSCPGCNLAKSEKTSGRTKRVASSLSSIPETTSRGCWVGIFISL